MLTELHYLSLSQIVPLLTPCLYLLYPKVVCVTGTSSEYGEIRWFTHSWKARREVELQFSYQFPSCFKIGVICMVTCFFAFFKGGKQGPLYLKTYDCILKLSTWAVSVDQRHLLLVNTGEQDFCKQVPNKICVWEELQKNYSLRNQRQWKETHTQKKQETGNFSYLIWLLVLIPVQHFMLGKVPFDTGISTHLTLRFLHKQHSSEIFEQPPCWRLVSCEYIVLYPIFQVFFLCVLNTYIKIWV